MNDYIEEQLDTPENSQQTLGDYLRERRESMNYTRTDAASQLNLRLSVVEALENNDYTVIPRIVFARGYLRSYAKLLKLPADSIIAAFNQMEWPETKSVLPSAPLTALQKKAPKRERSMTHWIGLGILVLIFCVVGFWSSITKVLNVSTVIATAPVTASKETTAPAAKQELPAIESDNSASEQSSLPSLSELIQEN